MISWPDSVGVVNSGVASIVPGERLVDAPGASF
jgi:hypothetical protein